MAGPRGLPAGPPNRENPMIRLITAGACALFLAGCGAEPTTGGEGGNTPAANEVATDTSAKFELGKDI